MSKKQTRVRIKLCGVRTVADALLCAEAGADEVGVIFARTSKRIIALDEAVRIRAALPALVPLVGVFLDARLEEIAGVLRAVRLQAVQLHGALDLALLPDPRRLLGAELRWVRALHVSGPPEASGLAQLASFSRILLDSPKGGGSGSAFAWSVAPAFRASFAGELFVAGGLTPDNVAAAIDAARPDGVDVASGIEGPDGFKDPARVRAFIEHARAASLRAAQESA